MEESILLTIKKLVGDHSDEGHFDLDIITAINTSIMNLYQLGLASAKGFRVTDSSAQWTDLTTSEEIESIKSYIHMKTKLMFDPPSNSFLVDALKKELDEIEWRITFQLDPIIASEETPDSEE